MAFPSVVSITETSFSSATTSHNVSMPATVAANDILLVLFTNDATSTVTKPSAWNELWSIANGTNSAVRLSGYWRRSDGSEGGTTVDFVTSEGQEACAQVYRISGAHTTTDPVCGTAVNTITSSTPNPPSLNPSTWDVEDTLWIACYGADDDDDATAAPTDFTNLTYTQASTSGTLCSMGSARRELAAASVDPGTFTINASEEWVAQTVAIRPAGAAAQTLNGSAVAAAATTTTGALNPGSVSLAGAAAAAVAAVTTGMLVAVLLGAPVSAAASATTGVLNATATLAGAAVATSSAVTTGALAPGAVTLAGSLRGSAAPTVLSITETTVASASTTHNIAMPATVDRDDTLLVLLMFNGSPLPIEPAGWSWMVETGFEDVITFAAYWRRANGTEGGTTVNFATESSATGVAQVYRIRDGHLTTDPALQANGDSIGSTAPDPPALNPTSWDTENTLWLAAYAAADGSAPTDAPTNYSQLEHTATGGRSLGSAHRRTAVASEDPGAFTIPVSAQWVTTTFAIRPRGVDTAATTGGLTATLAGSAVAASAAVTTGVLQPGAATLSGVPVNAGAAATTSVLTPGSVTLAGSASSASAAVTAGTATSVFTLAGSPVTARAFPQVISVTASTFTTAATTHNVQMPASVVAGDVLVLLWAGGDGSGIWDGPFANWTGSSANPGARSYNGFYNLADGSESGATFDLQTFSACKGVAQIYQIRGGSYANVAAAVARAAGGVWNADTDANPDPISVTPNWGNSAALWLTFYGAPGNPTISSLPANYGNSNYTAITEFSLGSARRQLTAASEDTGPFTISASADWQAGTLAIYGPPDVTIGTLQPGAATLNGSPVAASTAVTTGALNATATLAGAAVAATSAATSGALAPGSVTLAGSAVGGNAAVSTGTLAATATLAGSAATSSSAVTTGALQPGSATVAGSPVVASSAVTTGALTAVASLAGSPATAAATTTTGALQPGAATLAGAASGGATATAGALNATATLAGAAAATSSAATVGAVNPGVTTLAGSASGAATAATTGVLNASATLAGVAVTASSTTTIGTVAPGAVSIAGTAVSGNAAATTGALASTATLAGAAVAANSAVTIGTLQPGTVALAGAAASAASAATVGAINPGAATLAGAPVSASAGATAGALSTGSALTLSGSPAAGSAAATAGVLTGSATLSGAPAGAASATAGAITPGSVTLAGSPSAAAAAVTTGGITATLHGAAVAAAPATTTGTLVPGAATAAGSAATAAASSTTGALAATATLSGSPAAAAVVVTTGAASSHLHLGATVPVTFARSAVASVAFQLQGKASAAFQLQGKASAAFQLQGKASATFALSDSASVAFDIIH